MKIACRLFTLTFVLLVGFCSMTRAEDYGDFRHTPTRRKVYSRYYDGAAWLIPKHLGMSVVVENEKMHIPLIYDIQRWRGESFAKGKVTVFLYNFDSRVHPVRVLDISPEVDPSTIPGKVIYAAPHRMTGAVMGEMGIFDRSRDIPIRVRCEFNGRRWAVELLLERRTKGEEARYFGPDWNAPYPWGWPGGKR
jgi:hypothetical protein